MYALLANVLSFANEFKEPLVAILDDGLKQATQNLVVTEALGAAVLLLKLHRLDANKGKEVKTFSLHCMLTI